MQWDMQLNMSQPHLVSLVRQQQVLPGPVKERADGREEAYGGTKRAAFGERWANKEQYPQEFSISKYAFF